MDSRRRHARRRVAGRIGALVAAVLVVPGLALAPAHAALGSAALPIDPNLNPLEPVLGPLDPVLDPATRLVTPVVSGAGQVTGPGLSCVNATSGQITCADSVTLSDIGGSLTTVLLQASPAAGWEFAGWSGDCAGTSTTCTLDATALSGALDGTPLAPIATFVPADGAGEPNPLCEPSGGAAPGIDCEPPVTVLKTKPAVRQTTSSDGAGVTKATTATFTFAAVEPNEDGSAGTTPTPGATFACRLLKKPETTGAFAACPGSTSGTASYSGLTDGTYEFAVRASDAEDNTDATPETFTWTVDTTAPETVLTSRTKFWVLARKATFGLGVAPPDGAADVHGYQCYLDGAGRMCPTVTFGEGTHTFKAAATDKAGNTDETPVAHSFTMPVNNTSLNHSKGWTKAKVKGAFLNSASITTRKGAKLATNETGITRIALVASKGKGFGTVKVMLGKKTLKQVSLAHSRNVKKKVVPIATFSSPTSGKVTVVVLTQGKKVVIEGLGIATR